MGASLPPASIKSAMSYLSRWNAAPIACPDEEHAVDVARSEEHTSELQSPCNLVCRLLLEKKKNTSELQSPCNLVCRLLLEKKKQNILIDQMSVLTLTLLCHKNMQPLNHIRSKISVRSPT